MLLVIIVVVLLCLKKYTSRRVLTVSLLCSAALVVPLIQTWDLVGEHYTDVADRSSGLAVIMVA